MCARFDTVKTEKGKEGKREIAFFFFSTIIRDEMYSLHCKLLRERELSEQVGFALLVFGRARALFTFYIELICPHPCWRLSAPSNAFINKLTTTSAFGARACCTLTQLTSNGITMNSLPMSVSKRREERRERRRESLRTRALICHNAPHGTLLAYILGDRRETFDLTTQNKHKCRNNLMVKEKTRKRENGKSRRDREREARACAPLKVHRAWKWKQWHSSCWRF